MKKLGLDCIAVSGHCNLTDEARLNDFRDNMALARRFGARYIISSTGEAHFGKDEAFTDDVLIENIKKLLPDLEKYGLKLGIEVHGEYSTGAAVARVVKEKDELTIISASGVVLRLKVSNISESSRATRGTKIMNLEPGNTVAALARIQMDILGNDNHVDEKDPDQDENESTESDQVVSDEQDPTTTEENDKV
jgi:hypothetical protein